MDALFFILQMDTFFFSHDYNARSDDKIKRLIRKHGMIGYGVFWAIVEDLYQNANAMRTDCEGIAYDLRVQSDLVQSVLFDFDLFIHEGDIFGSISIQKRLEQRLEKSIKASKSAHKRWNNANALRPHSDRNAIKESKVKESKVKDIIDNTGYTSASPPARIKKEPFKVPTLEDVKAFAQAEMIGDKDLPDRFHNYYESNGWKVGKNSMKSWTAAYKNWSKNENHGTYQQSNFKQGTGKTQSETDFERWKNLGTDLDKGRRQLSEMLNFPTDQ